MLPGKDSMDFCLMTEYFAYAEKSIFLLKRTISNKDLAPFKALSSHNVKGLKIQHIAIISDNRVLQSQGYWHIMESLKIGLFLAAITVQMSAVEIMEER